MRLFSRNEKDWTSRFPEIADAIAELPVDKAVLDGEVVALAPNGASSFRLLQEALSSQRTAKLIYQVFDLLHLDGYDLTGVTQLERKRALKRSVGSGSIRRRRAREVHRSHRRQRRRCSFARRAQPASKASSRSSPMRRIEAGRGRGWLKTKCTQHEELVIGGYTDPAGSRTGFGALLLGAFDDDGKLTYMGRVGTGFDARQLQRDRRSSREAVDQQESIRYAAAGARRALGATACWLPKSSFTERTREGMLRHPSFRGLREDKDANEIDVAAVGERPLRRPTRPRAATQNQRAWLAIPSDDSERSSPACKLTHPDRVLWPERGITKLQLARYYEAIESWLMPSLANRPLALLRCPDGQNRRLLLSRSTPARR